MLKDLGGSFRASHGRSLSTTVTVAPVIKTDGSNFPKGVTENEKHRFNVYNEIIDTEWVTSTVCCPSIFEFENEVGHLLLLLPIAVFLRPAINQSIKWYKINLYFILENKASSSTPANTSTSTAISQIVYVQHTHGWNSWCLRPAMLNIRTPVTVWKLSFVVRKFSGYPRLEFTRLCWGNVDYSLLFIQFFPLFISAANLVQTERHTYSNIDSSYKSY